MNDYGDSDFFHTGSDLLFSDPVAFYKNGVPQKCGLHYIDPLFIGPAEGKKNVWITYMGDSMNRNLFYELAPRFSNYIPKENEDFVKSIQHTYPLLGPHDGPPSDATLGGKLATFHNHKLLCCQNIDDRSRKVDANYNCMYALQDRSDAFKGSFDKDGQKGFGYYLFEDIADFVERKVAAKYGESGYTCLSMIWAPTYSSAKKELEKIYSLGFKDKDQSLGNYGVTENKHRHMPDAIIMNMGIHQFDTDDHETLKFKNYTDALYEKYKPVILYHSPGAINENNKDYTASAKDWDMKHLIHLIGDRVKHNEWPAIAKYLNFYDFSRKMHMSGCSDDGIHFASDCVHDSLISQWDLNWLKKLGVIKSFDRTLRFK